MYQVTYAYNTGYGSDSDDSAEESDESKRVEWHPIRALASDTHRLALHHTTDIGLVRAGNEPITWSASVWTCISTSDQPDLEIDPEWRLAATDELEGLDALIRPAQTEQIRTAINRVRSMTLRLFENVEVVASGSRPYAFGRALHDLLTREGSLWHHSPQTQESSGEASPLGALQAHHSATATLLVNTDQVSLDLIQDQWIRSEDLLHVLTAARYVVTGENPDSVMLENIPDDMYLDFEAAAMALDLTGPSHREVRSVEQLHSDHFVHLCKAWHQMATTPLDQATLLTECEHYKSVSTSGKKIVRDHFVMQHSLDIYSALIESIAFESPWESRLSGLVHRFTGQSRWAYTNTTGHADAEDLLDMSGEMSTLAVNDALARAYAADT